MTSRREGNNPIVICSRCNIPQHPHVQLHSNIKTYPVFHPSTCIISYSELADLILTPELEFSRLLWNSQIHSFTICTCVLMRIIVSLFRNAWATAEEKVQGYNTCKNWASLKGFVRCVSVWGQTTAEGSFRRYIYIYRSFVYSVKWKLEAH